MTTLPGELRTEPKYVCRPGIISVLIILIITIIITTPSPSKEFCLGDNSNGLTGNKVIVTLNARPSYVAALSLSSDMR